LLTNYYLDDLILHSLLHFLNYPAPHLHIITHPSLKIMTCCIAAGAVLKYLKNGDLSSTPLPFQKSKQGYQQLPPSDKGAEMEHILE
jgi:hypothetical protein